MRRTEVTEKMMLMMKEIATVTISERTAGNFPNESLPDLPYSADVRIF